MSSTATTTLKNLEKKVGKRQAVKIVFQMVTELLEQKQINLQYSGEGPPEGIRENYLGKVAKFGRPEEKHEPDDIVFFDIKELSDLSLALVLKD